MYLVCLFLVYLKYNACLSRAVSHNENARHVGCVKSSNDRFVLLDMDLIRPMKYLCE